ncbi:MAG: tRNA (N6-threonylcarbamoyladenosine(37)-N6)-methyltransferase TrmO [Ruminococcaceae bacterium]|nr:tRNA (N6-threonylcarbamoyladenosine(37)-N6)-methyltransferase TrmO [Oscillospiraceae bacterium]
MKIIAHIENDFKEKFGIPRQSGITDELISTIVFEPEYRVREALRGIEGYSHLWLIWQFSEALRDSWSPTVRPPRLGGNKRVGVFATRSPFRPNPIGLSSVRLIEVRDTYDKGCVLIVAGADLMNGTPIYDIKPYLSFTDSHPDAISGFADEVKEYSLRVDFPDKLAEKISPDKRDSLIKILAGDPRPSYIADGDRAYTFTYADYEISFTVNNGTVTVINIENKG